MYKMSDSASSFSHVIDTWNTATVTTTYKTLFGLQFQSGHRQVEQRRVTTMQQMFRSASSFDMVDQSGRRYAEYRSGYDNGSDALLSLQLSSDHRFVEYRSGYDYVE
jgi:hypothetical protein